MRYGFVVECTNYELDNHGHVTTVYCNYFPETKSGTEGSDSIKVKGNIHWLSTNFSKEITIRNYDRLFLSENPSELDNFLDDINQSSIETKSAYCEESISDVKTGEQFQFERHGYYIVDPDSNVDEIIFNRTATLRDNWQK